MSADRYTHLEAHADCGLGAEEPEVHRFTRLCERAELQRESVEAVTQRRLDADADQAWRRFEDFPRDHPHRDMLRDLAFAAKDRADEFARSRAAAQSVLRGGDPPKTVRELVDCAAQAVDSKMPPTSRQAKVEGATPNPQKESDV